jgi:hypothetical protein
MICTICRKPLEIKDVCLQEHPDEWTHTDCCGHLDLNIIKHEMNLDPKTMGLFYNEPMQIRDMDE